jgi:toxin-antitoxin system PIN domain toxin
MAPDVNVLIAAARDDHPHHRQAREWLDRATQDCLNGGSIELLPMVVSGFLRVSTNARAFVMPLAITEAISFIDALLSIPGVEISELGREWPTLRQLCVDHALSANDVPDAWIAAAVRATGSHLVTFDRGFLRLLGRSELTVLQPQTA